MNDYKKLDNLITSLDNFEDILLSDIPSIDLYMDQLTTFMENKLKNYKRNDTDKIITKTMINNYAKNMVIPRPIKKKYSKSHIILLIFIYHMKHTISFNDIQKLLLLINNEGDNFADLNNIYNSFLEIKHTEINKATKNFKQKIEKLKQKNKTNNIEDEDLFDLIISLIIQSNIQKYLVEKIIDTFIEK